VVKVYDAGNITEAHIVRGMLRSHGIEAHVGGHYLQGGIGELVVQGFATVYVEDSEVVAARSLIDAYELGEL
jgi:hypothetical protein